MTRSRCERLSFGVAAVALLMPGVIPNCLKGQQPGVRLSGIAHVAIRVGDLERSRVFYHTLGYEEAFAMNNGGAPTEAFFKINDLQFIELYPKREPGQAAGFMHVCFESQDLNALYADYAAHGLNPTSVKRAGAGNLLFTIQGPDEPVPAEGLRPAATQNIEYTQYMPGSRHTLDRGQHLGANRIADKLIGVAIPVSDAASARTFYIDKLFFAQAKERNTPDATVSLPGDSGQWVELTSEIEQDRTNALPFRVHFAVANVKQTARRLTASGIAVRKLRHEAVAIEDPDGNELVFANAESLRAAR
jgi:catechol 2,3-dioxygenase-like lactoylglutathione lyase family enzyme